MLVCAQGSRSTAQYTNLSAKKSGFRRALLHRPKHSGSLLLNYASSKWGGNLGGSSLVGVRIRTFSFAHADRSRPGYARLDIGGWYKIHSPGTAYVNVENALNRHYQEVAGVSGVAREFPGWVEISGWWGLVSASLAGEKCARATLCAVGYSIHGSQRQSDGP